MSAAVSCVSRQAEVLCDICTEPRLKASKSCLVCLASFCESHLHPHKTLPDLKKHQLMDPVENLEDISIDHGCVCNICPVPDQKNHHHECLSLEETSEIKQLVDQRLEKIRHIWRSVDLSEKGLQDFTALMQSVQKRQEQFLEDLHENHRQTQRQAQDLVQELEQEISELRKKETDHLSALKDWSTVNFEPETFGTSAVRTLSELQKKIDKDINVFKAKLMDLKDLQKFAVDVILDPETVSPRLFLSEDLKQVHDGGMVNKLPNNPERFTYYLGVLGQQSFSSGRFYFEVQVKGKVDWALGVARESIKRKEYIDWCPQSGIWVIGLNRDQFTAYSYPCVPLSLESPLEKVGVFVDYDLGLVSFYDVENVNSIYSFTGCSFRKKIFPFLNPGPKSEGRNTIPLIVTEVRK